jgi:hypothetical protein
MVAMIEEIRREDSGSATIHHYGQLYSDAETCVSTSESETRVTVYPPYRFLACQGRLPLMVDVEWFGDRFEAELGYEDGMSVYRFRVED